MHLFLDFHAVLAGLWGLLILASLIVYGLTRSKPDADFSELVTRTKSWWMMIGIFSIAMLTTRTVSVLFFALISFLALKEYFSMIPTRRVDRRVLFWAYLAIPLHYYWIYAGWYGMFIIFIPVYMFLFLPVRMLLNQQTEGFLRAVGTLNWGLMISVFTLSHAAYLLMLPALPGHAHTGAGAGLVLALVFLTQFNDVAQYCWGKCLGGKHKVVPAVSPGKSWEGLLGGMVSTTLAAMAIGPLLTPFSIGHAAAAGLLISIAGFFGDLTISAVKRDLGIKDTGALIPGHGGILDRVDSLTFTAPLFFHFTHYLYY